MKKELRNIVNKVIKKKSSGIYFAIVFVTFIISLTLAGLLNPVEKNVINTLIIMIVSFIPIFVSIITQMIINELHENDYNINGGKFVLITISYLLFITTLISMCFISQVIFSIGYINQIMTISKSLLVSFVICQSLVLIVNMFKSYDLENMQEYHLN